MASRDEIKAHHTRELAQLLRLHGRLLVQLQKVRTELQAPGTGALLRDVRKRTGITTGLGEVAEAIEEAIRAIELSESSTRAAVLGPRGTGSVDGSEAAALPEELQRFLAERKDMPGFTYDLVQDEVRGWTIRWKEYTDRGTVRGYGQFYERPYAWIEG